MSFYSGLQETSSRLIKEYGAEVTLTRTTLGTFDPVSGSTSGETTTNFKCHAVLTNYDIKHINDTQIQLGDKKVTLSAKDLGTKPEMTDTISEGGITYSIKNIQPLNPGGIDLIYELQCRA